MACNKYNKSCGDPDQQVRKIIIAGHRVIRTVQCSFLVCVSHCIGMCSVAHNDMCEKFFHLFVPIACFCLFVPRFTLDAGLLARSQYPEGPATGHLDTGFSWFPCVYKQLLRRFPSFQVATTCFSCSPPHLNFLVTYLIFVYV
jgi:hypothetical protein